jgi:hypothetical protein
LSCEGRFRGGEGEHGFDARKDIAIGRGRQSTGRVQDGFSGERGNEIGTVSLPAFAVPDEPAPGGDVFEVVAVLLKKVPCVVVVDEVSGVGGCGIVHSWCSFVGCRRGSVIVGWTICGWGELRRVWKGMN